MQLYQTIYDEILKENSHHFKNHPSFIPFIGKKYQETKVKVLIIAESHYLPKNKGAFSVDDWYLNPQIIYKKLTEKDLSWIDTRGVLLHYLKSKKLDKGHGIFRNMETAFAELYPDSKLFEECAYMNYFQRPAEKEGETINATDIDKEIAYKTLLRINEILKPNKLIFVSQKAFKSFKENLSKKDKFNLPYFISVPHPSASSWWNRKSKKYGLNSKGEIATGKEKFQRVITVKN